MTQDGSHGYTHDAEGNILAVDGGGTASYVYDALNRRARARASGSISEYLHDYAGRRTSSWLNPSAGEGDEGRIYWDGRQIAFRSGDGTTYFDQQDRLGTERLRANYLGAVEAKYLSLPFGDGYSAAVNDGWGDGPDSLRFAGLDHDAESSTEHAQFRNYSSAQGRWLAPDPYDGSYDITNPQSLNRYAYVLNNPLSFTDQLGLEDDDGGDNGGCDPGDPGCDPGGGGGGGDGGDGGGGSGGSYGASYGQYPPGTVLVDENGNYWVVNQNGGLDPTNPPGTAQWDYVNGGGCSPSDPACAAWLSTLTSWPNQGSGNGPCAPPFVCPTPLRPAPNNPHPQQQQQQQQQPKPGWCTALEHAGATTGVLGAGVFLWGTIADTTVVGIVIGVPVQTVGGIGMAVGTIGYGIGDAGIALGLCH